MTLYKKIALFMYYFLRNKKTDTELFNMAQDIFLNIYEHKAANTNNILLLDLFHRAGFIVTPEFDGKSWVVVA